MTRAIVNVATGSYVKGQQRLFQALAGELGNTAMFAWGGSLATVPASWPSHKWKPYAFKAYAMQHAAAQADLLLWCDACILPVRLLEPLWARIERDGYWMSRNGWTNYEWTADTAYRDLFPEFHDDPYLLRSRSLNRKIPHVVATAFGLNVKHPKGAAFLAEYYRLASETNAFCGPWTNADRDDTPRHSVDGVRVAVCGPPDVRGHRHDQTAASVIAWRQAFELTDPPDVFAYAPSGWKPGEAVDQSTILVADGAY